jgi:hypothetical protein
MPLELSALTDAIDKAFGTEWTKAKGGNAPDAGKDDRRLMFAAVARGFLEYLSAQQNDLIASLTLTDTAGNASIDYNASATSLNINVDK